jgi:iron complex outermembrane recepter protein
MTSKATLTRALFHSLLAGTTLSVFAVGTAAFAQSASEDEEARSSEIIVTARKRAESLQDVPLAVTAIGREQLETASANTIDDLDRLAPNVELSSTSFSAKSLTATIRGIGFADVEKSFEPAVGVSVDGVFFATSGGASIDAFDIESVEILRGPQGTLYGRNTVGGVINVRRTAPTDDAGFRMKLRYGNNGRAEALAVANTGRFGGFALKGYYFLTTSDTYARNTVTNRKDKLTDNKSFGFALSYKDDGPLTGVVSFDRFIDKSGQNPVYNLSQTGATFCNLTRIPLVNLAVSRNAGCSSASYDLAVASNFETFIRPLPVENSTDGIAITANFDLEVGKNFSLTSVTGYRDSDETLRTDNLGSPLVTLAAGPVVPLFFAGRNVASDQFSQELRLSGKLGDNFDIVTGLFYMNSSYFLTGATGPNGVGFGNSFAFGGVSANQEVGQDTDAYAAFADGTFKLSDSFSISAGLRYSYEKKTLNYNFIRSPVAGVTGQNVIRSGTFDDLSGRIILQYNLTDDIMAFGGWSRGFRSGGFNGRATTPTAIGPYDPETVDSFEGGLRIEAFDRAVRFNPTVFYTKYRNKQEEVSRAAGASGTITETVVQNAASAKIWGVELEAQARASDALSFSGSVGYLNAKYDKFLLPNGTDVTNLRQLRRAPKWTAALGTRFEQPLGGVKLIATADYNYVAKNASDLVRDTFVLNGVPLRRDIIGAQSNFDFTLSVASNSDRGPKWKVTGYIRDAFDNNAGRLAAVLDVGAFYFGAGQVTKQYGLELEFGL